jgi:hypothetical protein
LTGKSLYSNYAEGDKILHFMLRDKIDMSAGYPKVALTVKTVVERELDKMAEEYKYIETMHGFPIFERIE